MGLCAEASAKSNPITIKGFSYLRKAYLRKRVRLKEWGGPQASTQQTVPQLQSPNTIDYSVIPDYLSASFLRQKYEAERLTIAEIAETLGVAESTVHKYLRKHEIPIRGPTGKSKSRLAYGEAWRDRKVVRHQREQETLQKIVDLRAKGFSYWKIADVLNSMKVPTKTRRGKWHARSVQKILDENSQ
jgi:hypothetical protein